MSVLYCSHCGAKLEYAVQKPKFCSSCGAAIGTPPSQANHVAAEERKMEELPDLKKLEYEISFEEPRLTLGALMESDASDPSTPARPPLSEKEKNKTAEEVLAESVAQCKSARQPRDAGE